MQLSTYKVYYHGAWHETWNTLCKLVCAIPSPKDGLVGRSWSTHTNRMSVKKLKEYHVQWMGL